MDEFIKRYSINELNEFIKQAEIYALYHKREMESNQHWKEALKEELKLRYKRKRERKNQIREKCPECKGFGEVEGALDLEKCSNCKGTGEIIKCKL